MFLYGLLLDDQGPGGPKYLILLVWRLGFPFRVPELDERANPRVCVCCFYGGADAVEGPGGQLGSCISLIIRRVRMTVSEGVAVWVGWLDWI